MVRSIAVFSIALLLSGIVFSEETRNTPEPPEIVLDTSPANTEATSNQYETITVYESKVFPGFRTCTPEDYRKQDYDPIACQDEEAARVISTREEDLKAKRQPISDNVVPQGNIYKLRFERFKREKK